MRTPLGCAEATAPVNQELSSHWSQTGVVTTAATWANSGCAGLDSGLRSPRDIVNREKRRERNGRRRHPGEGLDVVMEVGLVGVTAVGRYQGGAVTRGKEVSGVVETHQLRGTLGSEAHLSPEPGPQAFAAPSGLGCQPVDPNSPLAGHHLAPGEGNFRVDHSAGVVPSSQRGLRDRKPFLPRTSGSQLLLGSRSVAPPEVIEGHDRPAELRGGTQDGVRDDGRQPHLEALEAPAASPSNALGRESGDNTVPLALLTTADIDNDRRVTEVEDHYDSRRWDDLNVQEVIHSIAEPSHGDPRQRWPGRDRDVPWRHAGTSRLSRPHVAMLRATPTGAPTQQSAREHRARYDVQPRGVRLVSVPRRLP